MHLCTTDVGGAGSAVVRINNLFNERGYDSAILVLKKNKDSSNIIDVSKRNITIWLIKVIRKVIHEIQQSLNRKIIDKYNYFNYSERLNYLPSKLLISKLPFKPNFIIVHYTSHFLNSRNVYELYQHTKANIIYTMMDMSPLTGGCHYAWDCKGYQNECGNCPAITSDKMYDETFSSLMYKKKFINMFAPTMVVASEWSLQQAKKSSLFNPYFIEKILLPIDENIFMPGNKLHAKNSFHIDTNYKVIFVGAQSIDDERKGFSYLIRTLNILYNNLQTEVRSKILILAAGDKDISKLIPFHVKYIGLIKSNQTLIKAYNAADLFLCPSIEDSGPMMINESIMCGTPVVSFEMGVSLDLVSNKSGYLAKIKDPNDMAYGIELVLFHYNLKELSNNCRQLAISLYSHDAVYSNWRKLFNQLMEE